MRLFGLCLLVALLMPSGPVEGGLLSRKSKPRTPTPAERVYGLLENLKNAPDSDQRQEAAEQLREFNAQEFPEIIPALIYTLQKDSSSSVRREAAQSLGRIRPTSMEVAQALEIASEKDSSVRVRLQARASKSDYKATEPMPNQGGSVIPVPPPGPDGRLKPVPLPPPTMIPETQPLPKPPPADPGARLGPATPRPLPMKIQEEGTPLENNGIAPTALPKPPPAPKRSEPEETPILIRPRS